jgi:hypothetical protein
MTDSPYAIPVEDLVDSIRVPLARQVEGQTEHHAVPGESFPGPLLWADGIAGDADGE